MITLTWVLGHAGIEGNKKADSAAKLGVSPCTSAPNRFWFYLKSNLERKVDEWINATKTNYWVRSPGLRQSKRLSSLSRINIRVLIGVLTGHCPLLYHLNKMGLEEITE
ncbi:unnamed protein product, partial [Nesidiocoris tenuis]